MHGRYKDSRLLLINYFVIIDSVSLRRPRLGKVKVCGGEIYANMKRYVVYLDVLGYSKSLEKDQKIALNKIKKFYEIVEESVKSKENILLLYSDCAQLVFEKLDDTFCSVKKIFNKCYEYSKECVDKKDFDSTIFLQGGIAIDESFPSDGELIEVDARANKCSYASKALADAYHLSEARRGAVMFVPKKVFDEYDNDTAGLKDNFYCYQRLFNAKEVGADFGWMYDKDLGKINEVIKFAEEMCKKYPPSKPPPSDHPELNSAVRIYQQYEETLKLSLRCLGYYIKHGAKPDRAKEILKEFLDYEFPDAPMHDYNWGIWLIAFQSYFRGIASSGELSEEDEELLKEKFLTISHSDKMDDFHREWRQNPEFHELDREIPELFTDKELQILRRLGYMRWTI